MTFKEMMEERKRIEDSLSEIDNKIKEMTDLPLDWTLDSGHGRVAGGVTLYGKDDERNKSVIICAYGTSLFIIDNEKGYESPRVDIDAIESAIKILRIKNKEKEIRRADRINFNRKTNK